MTRVAILLGVLFALTLALTPADLHGQIAKTRGTANDESHGVSNTQPNPPPEVQPGSALELTVWHSDGSAPVLFQFRTSSPGSQGTAAFAGHPNTPVVLQSFDGKTIRITADTASILGVSGDYTGRIDGNNIDGNVVLSDKQGRSVKTSWHGELGGASTPDYTTSRVIPFTDQEQICSSRAAVAAMQHIENGSSGDLAVALLTGLACEVTGVCPEDQGPSTAISGRRGSDAGRNTSQNPGSFVCQGMFLRGKVDLSTEDKSNPTSLLTEGATKKLLQEYPNFYDWFRVFELQRGHFRMDLLPTMMQLSKPYFAFFAYP